MRGLQLLSCLFLAFSACTSRRGEAVTKIASTPLPVPTGTAMLTSTLPTTAPTPLGGGGRIATIDPLWNGQIVTVDTDGKRSGRLNTSWFYTPGAPGWAMEPAWSPDGSKIAFAGFLNPVGAATATKVGPPRGSEIFVVNANGSGLMQLTRNTANDEGPAWSPDGTKIAFSSDNQIYMMEADGTNVRRLTQDGAFDSDASWSPDGRKIAFSSDVIGTGYGVIRSMNSDGTGITRLTGLPGNDIEPAWSPDGMKIIFASQRGTTHYGIYMMNADGSDQTSLTEAGGWLHSPQWSPDGKMIAYISNALGMFCLMSSNGSDTTCHFGAERWLSWSRP